MGSEGISLWDYFIEVNVACLALSLSSLTLEESYHEQPYREAHAELIPLANNLWMNSKAVPAAQAESLTTTSWETLKQPSS